MWDCRVCRLCIRIVWAGGLVSRRSNLRRKEDEKKRALRRWGLGDIKFKFVTLAEAVYLSFYRS
jgi:hypothetical protein